MFNVGSGEFLLILLVALIVLGPTRLPDALRQFGRVLGEAKKLSSNFQNEMNDAMKDPVKLVTGEETPKLPKVPRTSKELLGFAVPEPFSKMEASAKPGPGLKTSAESPEAAKNLLEGADEQAASKEADEQTASTPTADAAVPTSVEPAELPPKLVGQVSDESKPDNRDAGSVHPADDDDDDDDVPMFGDR